MFRTLFTALIVDDNRPMRLLVREMLLAMGFRRCLEASDTIEALDLLRTTRVSLAIVDLMLGDEKETGVALIRRIREGDAGDARIPIIMMSGHGERRNVHAAIEAGVTSFLVKPISGRTLAEHAAFALDDPRPFAERSSGLTHLESTARAAKIS